MHLADTPFEDGCVRVYRDQRGRTALDGQRPCAGFLGGAGAASPSRTPSGAARRPVRGGAAALRAEAEQSVRTVFKAIKPKSLQIFSRQSATMIEAGLNVVAALV